MHPFDSASKIYEFLIPINSCGPVSFILEHIMNKWACRWFVSENSGRANIPKERRMTGARKSTLASLRGASSGSKRGDAHALERRARPRRRRMPRCRAGLRVGRGA